MDDGHLRYRISEDLWRGLLESDDVDDFLRVAVDLAPAHIDPEAAYSMTALVYGNLLTVASTSDTVWEVDQVEYEDADGGPCVDAIHQAKETSSVDLADDDRWPAWRAKALSAGFRSAAGIPAETGHEESRLALNLYSRRQGAFAEPVMAAGRRYTAEVARALRLQLRLDAQTKIVRQLEEALVSRSTIDQALGVIMGQNRCSRDDAFRIIRQASSRENRKLRDVAAQVITQLTGHAPPPPHEFQRR